MEMQAIIYAATVWFIGFAAGSFRAIRDDSDISYRDLLGVGGTAGFLSYGIALVLVSLAGTDREYGLAVAALVGVAGKEVNDAISKQVFQKIITRLSGEKENDDKETQ